ncbi:uncharacterized protein Fot_55447 [Forsythia ovata]|uniref:Uncharacterized protein n=1 Tax=Forsythia ovata TaxID=205694 RepID=A0ABD1P4S6_9LAMI
MTCISLICNSPECSSGDRRFSAEAAAEAEGRCSSLPSSSTSSIGKNSDESDGDGEEVQSEYKGGPLDGFDALEKVLPIKKGISKFYCGKSKSFTSLSDAPSCLSVKDIGKPDDAYTRKRKNLLAYNNFWDKNRNNILRSNNGGISKRPANSRNALIQAATMSCSESNNSEISISNLSSPGGCLPPLPPHARKAEDNELSLPPPSEKFAPWRSFSLSDLQGAAAAGPSITGLWIINKDK